jgi:hypothetical protein
MHAEGQDSADFFDSRGLVNGIVIFSAALLAVYCLFRAGIFAGKGVLCAVSRLIKYRQGSGVTVDNGRNFFLTGPLVFIVGEWFMLVLDTMFIN